MWLSAGLLLECLWGVGGSATADGAYQPVDLVGVGGWNTGGLGCPCLVTSKSAARVAEGCGGGGLDCAVLPSELTTYSEGHIGLG